MLPKSDVMQYGGKGAILNHIKEKLPHMPMPAYTLKEHDASIDSITVDFDSMKKPVIVRSSSPHEYGDFEGIFHSEDGVYDRYDLERAIRLVGESATSGKAQKYASINGFDIDEKMNVIIQEQSESKYVGAIMRHPNNPDLIFMTQHDNAGRYKNSYDSFFFDESTQTNGSIRGFNSIGLDKSDAKFLVEKYKEIESLTEITNDHVLYVEFGFDPFVVYQARPFKKIETADFEIPDLDKSDKIMQYSNFVFGITPPEGIVLPVLKSVGFNEAFTCGNSDKFNECFDGADMMLNMFIKEAWMLEQMGQRSRRDHLNHKLPEWLSTTDDMMDGEPYCLLTSSAKDDEYGVDLYVPGMKGLVLGHTERFLVHDMMRLIKKADITVGIPSLITKDFYKETQTMEDKLRIISNGKESVVIRE